jgi:hypothetical protein
VTALVWFALLGGQAAWAAQLMVSPVIIAVGCPRGAFVPDVAPYAPAMLALATLLPAGVAALAAVGGYQTWRDSTQRRSARFLGLSGLLLDGIALVAIGLGGMPLLLFEPCLAP